MLRSAIAGLQPIGDPDSGPLAAGRRIHHLAPAVDAIPAGEVAWIGALPRLRIGGHPTVIQLDTAVPKQIDELGLPDRYDHRIASQSEIRTRNRRERRIQPHALDA